MDLKGAGDSMKVKCVATICALGGTAWAGHAGATTIYGDYGPASGEHLITFDSASPATLTSNILLTGLVSNDGVDELAFQPSTGQLYGLGSDHLYTINTTTGAATSVGTLSQLFSSQAGFNFNPVTGLIHVLVTNAEFIMNPANGAITPDGTVAFAAGDPNAGKTPSISGLAYSNNFAGATSTTMYDLNISNELATLTTENPSNSTLTTIGSGAGSFGGTPVGFAISPTGSAFAALQLNLSDEGNTRLYSVNLATGGLTEIDTIGGESNFLNVASIAVPVPEPASLITIGLGIMGLLIRRRPVA